MIRQTASETAWLTGERRLADSNRRKHPAASPQSPCSARNPGGRGLGRAFRAHFVTPIDPAYGPYAAGCSEGRRGSDPSQGDDPIRVLTLIAAWATLLICVAPAKAGTTRTASTIRTEIRQHVREVEHAKTTLRFFKHHSILFYKWKTKAAAHRDRAAALQVVRAGRVMLRRLRAELAPLVQPIPHLQQWLCIHSYEGAWNDPNAPYYGGLQMDIEFQETYGGDFVRVEGTADHWSPREQMLVAERAWKTRGFWPWPNTARFCGLLP